MSRNNEYARFVDRRSWQTSKRGNLWRMWEGITLTIVEQSEGFTWCIADSGGPHYPRVWWNTIDGAMDHLASHLGII